MGEQPKSPESSCSSETSRGEQALAATEVDVRQGPLRLRSTVSLCKHCQRIIDDWEATYAAFEHHTSEKSLSKSAKNGCQLCTLFLESGARVQDWYGWGLKKGKPTATVFRIGKGRRHELVIPCPRGIPPNARSRKGRTYVDPCIQFNVNIVPTSEQALDYDTPEPATSTMDALPLCRRWLQDCRRLHKTCKTSNAHSAPSRLIDISNGQVRLRSSEEVGFGAPYVTLSHRWGSLKFTTLTSANLGDFRRDIPPEALPKTFLDVIKITHYLGYQYLWIDSLCILQDSQEDWRKESSSMVHVYGNADLNIAATSAKDASEGCFMARKQNWRCQARSSKASGGALYELYSGRYVNAGPDMLLDRAWVVQERYLSRRTLHFNGLQILWECDEKPASEVFPLGHPSDFELEKWHMAFALRKHPLRRALWEGIVKRYSRAKLTRQTDKLVAIGGLARIIHATTHDEYVAGLWRENLEDQLGWSMNHRSTQRITPHIAPTWSWASTDAEVYWPWMVPKHDGFDNNKLGESVHPSRECADKMCNSRLIR